MELSDLHKVIVDHTQDDHDNFLEIKNELTTIKRNHLHHIQESMQLMVMDIKEIKTDLKTNTKETQEAKTNIGWIIKIGGGAWAVVLILFGAMVYIVREVVTK